MNILDKNLLNYTKFNNLENMHTSALQAIKENSKLVYPQETNIIKTFLTSIFNANRRTLSLINDFDNMTRQKQETFQPESSSNLYRLGYFHKIK